MATRKTYNTLLLVEREDANFASSLSTSNKVKKVAQSV